MNGSIIGNLADSLKVQVANKQLQTGRNLEWARRIVARHEAGEYRYRAVTLKWAQEALAKDEKR